jgi:hypothetical protein
MLCSPWLLFKQIRTVWPLPVHAVCETDFILYHRMSSKVWAQVILTVIYFHCKVEYFNKVWLLPLAVCEDITGLFFPRNWSKDIFKNYMNRPWTLSPQISEFIICKAHKMQIPKWGVYFGTPCRQSDENKSWQEICRIVKKLHTYNKDDNHKKNLWWW